MKPRFQSDQTVILSCTPRCASDAELRSLLKTAVSHESHESLSISHERAYLNCCNADEAKRLADKLNGLRIDGKTVSAQLKSELQPRRAANTDGHRSHQVDYQGTAPQRAPKRKISRLESILSRFASCPAVQKQAKYLYQSAQNHSKLLKQHALSYDNVIADQLSGLTDDLEDAVCSYADQKVWQCRLEELRRQFDVFLNCIESILTWNPVDVEYRLKREAYRLRSALPALACREELEQMMQKDSRFVIVKGETGSGKSTQVPSYLSDMSAFAGKEIICTQPRKLAAISLASRVVFEYFGGWDKAKPGKFVCFDIGGSNSACCADRAITYMTEAALLSRLKNDTTDLSNVGAIVIDEAHERTLYCDVLMGLLRDDHPKWKHIKVVIASATLDTESFSSFFNNAPVLEIPGRLFHVEEIYRGTIPDGVSLREAVVEEAFDSLTRHDSGHILCFLSSREDVEKCANNMEKRLKDSEPSFERGNATIVQKLYGQMEADEQVKVFEATSGRKVIFATNVAETSVTIDGVTTVIDAGTCKELSYDHQKRLGILREARISKSSAIQRKGRAGRTCVGRCIRLYSETDFADMPEASLPEVFRCPLAHVTLLLTCFNVEAEKFQWLSRPPDEDFHATREELLHLGAIELRSGNWFVTELGDILRVLPIEPRYGKLLFEAHRRNMGSHAVLLIAILQTLGQMFRGVRKGMSGEERTNVEKQVQGRNSGRGDLVTAYRAYVELERASNKQAVYTAYGIKRSTVTIIKNLVKDLGAMLGQVPLQFNDDRELTDDNVLQLGLFATFRNVCAITGNGKGKYASLLTGVAGVVHSGSGLWRMSDMPRYMTYESIIRTDRGVFFGGCSPVDELQVLRNFSSAFWSTVEKASLEMPTETVEISGLAQSIIRALQRVDASSQSLTGDKRFVYFDYIDGCLRTMATPTEAEQVRQRMCDAVNRTIDKVKNETMEERLEGGCSVVYGRGCVVQSILRPDESSLIIVRDIAPSTDIYQELRKFGTILTVDRFLEDAVAVRFASPKEAMNALSLNGELLGGKQVKVTTKGVRHARIQSSILLSFATSDSTCKALVFFDSVANANRCLNLNPPVCSNLGTSVQFKPSIRPTHVDGVSTRPVVENGIFAETQPSRVRHFVVEMTNLLPSIDEYEIFRLFSDRHLFPQAIFVSRKSFETKAATEGETGSLWDRLLSVAPGYDSATQFTAKKKGRCGIRFFYDSPNDCLRAESEAQSNAQDIGPVHEQPVRVETEFSSDCILHKRVFNILRNPLDELFEVFRSRGVRIIVSERQGENGPLSRKKEPKIRIRFQSHRLQSIEDALRRFHMISSGTPWSHPLRHLLFSMKGRELLENISEHVCYIYWDRSSQSITLYARNEEERKRAENELNAVLECLCGLELDQRIQLARGRCTSLSDWNRRLRKLVQTDDRLAQVDWRVLGKFPRVSLFFSARKDEAELLRKQLTQEDLVERPREVMYTQATKSLCPVCFTEPENPYRLLLCGHEYCSVCLTDMISSVSLPVCCIHHECSDSIHGIAWRDVSANASPVAVFNALKDKALSKFLLSDAGSTFSRCPKCVGNVLIAVSDRRNSLCEECLNRFCLDCSATTQKPVFAHPDRTCQVEQARMNKDIVAHINFIENELMNRRCPKCRQVFLDFTGCLALSCSNPNCNCAFCATCLKDCGTDAHGHVRNCEYNPNRGDYFLPMEKYEEVARSQISMKVREYLSSLDTNVRRLVLDCICSSLGDVGISISF